MPAVCDLAAMRDAFVKLGLPGKRDQPAARRRSRHRSLGAGRRVRHERRRSATTSSSSTSATTSATCSCAGASRRSRTSGSCRPAPASATRSTSSTSRASCGPTKDGDVAYPDSLVGTDSHTTMINGLGVFGWGVGGIEAEAVMLGQPMAMLIPEVVGFELTGKLPRGRDRDRPRADRHADAAQEGRRRQVRRVLRRGHRGAVARRPRDDREHGARVRRDDGLLPGRRRDARVPALHRPPRRAGRSSSSATARRTSCGTTRRAKLRFSDTLVARSRRRSSRRSPGRSARRIACRSRTSRRAWRKSVARHARRQGRLRRRPRSTPGSAKAASPPPGTLGRHAKR